MKQENTGGKIFYVYLDRTGRLEIGTGVDMEKSERVFYVGKGDANRIRIIPSVNKTRNKRWKNIVGKYGFNREIILATKDEKLAFQIEEELIIKYKTFEADWKDGSGWGANFTRGNNGHSGRTGELSVMWGKHHTDESKLKISKALTGTKQSKETKDLKSISLTGRKMSKESKLKMSKAKKDNFHLKENEEMEIRNKYASGEYTYRSLSEEYKVNISCINNILNGDCRKNKKYESKKDKRNRRTKLTDQQVIEIREKKSTGNYTNRQLGKEYNVDNSTIFNIVNFITHKNTERQG